MDTDKTVETDTEIEADAKTAIDTETEVVGRRRTVYLANDDPLLATDVNEDVEAPDVVVKLVQLEPSCEVLAKHLELMKSRKVELRGKEVSSSYSDSATQRAKRL